MDGRSAGCSPAAWPTRWVRCSTTGRRCRIRTRCGTCSSWPAAHAITSRCSRRSGWWPERGATHSPCIDRGNGMVRTMAETPARRRTDPPPEASRRHVIARHPFLSVLGVLLLGLVLLLVFWDWNWFKPLVERQVEARTGRTLQIEGDLDVDRFGWAPLVQVGKFT